MPEISVPSIHARVVTSTFTVRRRRGAADLRVGALVLLVGQLLGSILFEGVHFAQPLHVGEAVIQRTELQFLIH